MDTHVTPEVWDIARAEYENASNAALPVWDIARRHGIPAHTVRKRAKSEGWLRPSEQRDKARAEAKAREAKAKAREAKAKAREAKAIEAEAREAEAREAKAATRDFTPFEAKVVTAADLMTLHPSDSRRLNIPTVIATAAAINKDDLSKKHKQKLGQLRGIVEGMAQELMLQQLDDAELDGMARYVDALRSQSGEDTTAMPTANALKKLLNLERRADTLAKLVASMGKLVMLERLTFGVDDAESKDPTFDLASTSNETARRIAYIINRSKD